MIDDEAFPELLPHAQQRPLRREAVAADDAAFLRGQTQGYQLASRPSPGGSSSCRNLIDRIKDLLDGSRGEKGIERRQRHMLEDSRGLYDDWVGRGRPDPYAGRPPTDSWEGHAQRLADLLDALAEAMEQFEQHHCRCRDLTTREHCRTTRTRARHALNVDVPEKPAHRSEIRAPAWLTAAGGAIVDGVIIISEGALAVLGALVWVLATAWNLTVRTTG